MNRALLVGINNYPGNPLRGCLNDISDMADFLVARCAFAESDIRLLTDRRATKQAIVERLDWLLHGLQPGDRVLFHYSGHGAQVPTRNPQGEVDGLDEVICPVDFDWTDATMIRDKDFARYFSVIPAGVEFVWISDSCHSGDLTRGLPQRMNSRRKCLELPLDLAWRLRTARALKITPDTLTRSAARLNLALIAGCRSDQTSADAVFNKRFNGALTYYLLQTLKAKDGLKLPLQRVVERTRLALKKGRYEQIPQLEGSAKLFNLSFLGR